MSVSNGLLTPVETLEVMLSNLVDLKCCKVNGGYRTGTHVSFDFGEQVHRKHPKSERMELVSECSLYLECSWRLDATDSVILTCWSHDEDERGFDRLYIEELARLVDTTVISYSLEHPGCDLSLQFDNGLSLRVFCDQAINDEDSLNYLISHDATTIRVGQRSVISVIGKSAV